MYDTKDNHKLHNMCCYLPERFNSLYDTKEYGNTRDEPAHDEMSLHGAEVFYP